ncbi:MAG: PD-(D/E)XK nuclease family protein [bacterium]|nr:PD-(D/E)XK nuclease family protein [bacterium]
MAGRGRRRGTGTPAQGGGADVVPDTGLVCAPSAAARVAAAGTWLRARGDAAEVLVVAPTWEACDDLVRQQLGAAGARFGVVRLTLDRLAARLAAPALARDGLAPATELGMAAVAARAVHRLHEAGTFRFFAPVADRPGFPPAVARTIAELRMHDVGPAALAALPHGGADLAALATAIAGELAAAQLADRATMFAAAVAAARALPAPAPIGLPVLLLDLPIATALEEALVGALAGTGAPVLATVPTGDADAERRIARALRRPATQLPVRGAGALTALQQHLFAAGMPPRGRLDDGVHLRAWPGEARECVEIVRAIQTEAAAGTPFDRMAVLLHAPTQYASHLEEAFGRAEIPFFFARGARRPHPGGRALLTLLACAGEGCSARRFAEYLSLGQVPDPDAPARADYVPPENELLPAAPPPPPDDDDGLLADPDAAGAVAGTLRAPPRWERLLVDAAVIGGGLDRWQRRLDGLEAELRAQRAELEDEDEARAARVDKQLADLGHLRAFAIPIVERLGTLPPAARWGDWIERLSALAAAALRDPAPVLATLAELAPMAPVGPVDLDEVRLVLGPRLRDLTEPPPRRRYGAVFVGTTRAARGLAFDVVLVPGLAENLFPSKLVEDPILLDAQRRALARELPTEPERVAGERLALRLAVGAARRRVHLSYPRVDVERARPRVASFYALEALRAALGELPGFGELAAQAEREAAARLGWPAPERPDDAIDAAEYDLTLLAPLLDADEATVVGTANYLLAANPHLARALRARARRWIKRWTPADGLVDPDDLARAMLAPHQLERRSYSPTALQHYAACPYRFFLQAVHRLAPREEPVALDVMDPLTRGSLFHDVQFGVLTRLRDAGSLPLRPEGLDAAFAVGDAVLGEEAGRRHDALKPAIPRVWQDGIDALRADLREWLRRMADAEDGWVPQRFELAFGLPRGDRRHADPASGGDPVPVLAETLRLRGAIDLVERHPRGQLRVTDHKTGKVAAPAGVVVGGGQILQPLLYALAAEKVLGEPVTSGRLYYCTSTGEYTIREVRLDAQSRDVVGTVVSTIGDALRDGFLPAAPAERACRWCDYQAVCGPWEEQRVRLKPAERLGPLLRLRALS